MNKKTKKHKHSSHHKRNKRRYSHKHSIHHRRRNKRREISIIPATKSIPIFTVSNKPKGETILVNIKQPSGNIIPGLRDYNKNM